MSAAIVPLPASHADLAAHLNLTPSQSDAHTEPAWREVLDTALHPRRLPMSDEESLHLYHARAGLLPFEGQTLSTWHWGIEGPRVMLVHGWESRSTHWHAWVAELLAAGFRVSAIDLPAHGHSSGASTNVVEAGRAVLAFSQQLGAVHGLVGHSMGSAAALYAFAHGMRVKASVHLSGPVSARKVMQGVARMGGLDAAGTEALLKAFEARTGVPLDTMELPALAPGLRHPAVILHDPADPEVPFRASRELADAWPQARLVETPGTGHRRILRDASVIEEGVRTLQAAVETAAAVTHAK